MTDEAPRTAAAIAANVQRRIDKNIEELRERGYVVVEPAHAAALKRMKITDAPAGEERHEFYSPAAGDAAHLYGDTNG